MLPVMLAEVERADILAFDFLVSRRMSRDPFQMNAATSAAGNKGNKFVQSIAFATPASVWSVQLLDEVYWAVSHILSSSKFKVSSVQTFLAAETL